MIPVVVGTHPERTDWLNDCLKSIRATTKRRRVHVHNTGGYEVAALRAGVQIFDRFLFLQDSVTILSPDFWTVIDNTEGPAWLTGPPHMHLGIHDRVQLEPALTRYPARMDKPASIVSEGSLPMRVNYGTIWPDIVDANPLRVEHRHGRNNLVLGNGLFEKHKLH